MITFRFASLGKGRVDTFGRCYSPKFHSKYAGNMVISSFEDRGEGGGGGAEGVATYFGKGNGVSIWGGKEGGRSRYFEGRGKGRSDNFGCGGKKKEFDQDISFTTVRLRIFVSDS